ncbi:MAG TPA: hypothetical protein VK525_13355 [Candidatus Saccharimonadales bacterium]|nr:hypothetical protein [Candidatus Saccharimonadales bacterium]
MTTDALRPRNSQASGIGPDRRDARERYERYFFSGMAVLLLGTVFLGFAKTYYLAGMFRAPLPNWVVHLHGAAFTAWIVLLVVQTSLASAGRIDVHRRLGMAGFGLACAMVFLGALAGTDLLRRDGTGFGVNAKAFYAGTLGDMVIFGMLIFFAFRARFRPAVHNRLILIATITLMEAAINRWPFAIIERAPFMIDVFAYTFLAMLALYDLWSLRTVHPATIWGGSFLIVMQQLELPIGKTVVWQNFATWALERAKSIHGS